MRDKTLIVSAKKVEDIHILNKYEGVSIINLETEIFNGGLIPSFDDISLVSIDAGKNIWITIKLTSDSFQIEENDYKKLLHILELIKPLNIHGIKWSALNKDGTIDEKSLKFILENKGRLKLIFGRGIDSCRDYAEGLNTLKKYEDDLEFIATSGGSETAYDGLYNIKRAVEMFPGKVIAGSRVNQENFEKIIKETNVSGVHMYKGALKFNEEKNHHELDENILAEVTKYFE